jgi:hypothetical protein
MRGQTPELLGPPLAHRKPGGAWNNNPLDGVRPPSWDPPRISMDGSSWNVLEQHHQQLQPQQDDGKETVNGLALNLVERRPHDLNPLSGEMAEAWKHAEPDRKTRSHLDLILCPENCTKEMNQVQLSRRDLSNQAHRKAGVLPQASPYLVAGFGEKFAGEQDRRIAEEEERRIEIEERRSVIFHGSLYHDSAKVGK